MVEGCTATISAKSCFTPSRFRSVVSESNLLERALDSIAPTTCNKGDNCLGTATDAPAQQYRNRLAIKGPMPPDKTFVGRLPEGYRKTGKAKHLSATWSSLRGSWKG